MRVNVCPKTDEWISSLANFYMYFTMLAKFFIELFVNIKIIIGICTSAVMSEAFPVISIMFWKTKVASLKTFRSSFAD